MFTLDNRLKTAAGLCRAGRTAADVGCDHAQLACCLALEKGMTVTASDVRDGPLEAARRNVEKYCPDKVTVVKSDGLEMIDYADDVIICGMGGELIARIISGCRFLSADTRFILQPMTRANYLRTWLYENGFEIIEEHTAVDGERFYSVMLARYTGEKRAIDGVFALTGKITDAAHLRKIAEKLLKNADGMSRSRRLSDEDEKALRELAARILQKAEELE